MEGEAPGSFFEVAVLMANHSERSAAAPAPELPNGDQRVLIIGGGLIGLATAYQFLRRHEGFSVVVVEKESEVGTHQSGHNSGVLHAGLYYRPGSLKARLAVGGIRQMTAFCREHGIAHEVCGKLVVAVDESEVPQLRELLERGTANGLSGLRWMSAPEMREIEPHVGGVAAVHVPEEGIVDYPAVSRTLAQEIERLGGTVLTGAEVLGLRRERNGWIADTSAGALDASLLVNCAGLYSDRVARLAGERPQVQIVPFRGEYYALRPERAFLVRNLIYPVPDRRFPFLGVHLTRMVGGVVEAGPNAVLAAAREGYRKSDVNLRDLGGALLFPGLWRFMAKHPRMAWSEVQRSFSRERFGEALRRLVPELRTEDLVPGGAGVRAQAMSPSGELVQDFHILERPGALHLLNAPSPGATASLAIGEELVRRAAPILHALGT